MQCNSNLEQNMTARKWDVIWLQRRSEWQNEDMLLSDR